MNYYEITTLPMEDPQLTILHDSPKDTEHINYMMSTGKPITAEYPADAHIRMSPKEDGIVLGGLVANTCGLFIVHRKICELLLAHDQQHDALEILPLRILNHKGRLASNDHVIVNPLGTESCLDLKRSVIKRLEGAVVAVKEMVLSRKAINPKKALFRPTEDPHVYIARADWLKKLESLGLKHPNVLGSKVTIHE